MAFEIQIKLLHLDTLTTSSHSFEDSFEDGENKNEGALFLRLLIAPKEAIKPTNTHYTRSPQTQGYAQLLG